MTYVLFYKYYYHIIEAFNLEKKKIDDAEADWMLKKDISENYMLFLSIFNG